MSKKIEIYDCTLRDGAQGEHVNFNLTDKLDVMGRLDGVEFDYIEGGWPGSNPKDAEFFEKAAGVELKHAKLTSFSSTRRAGNAVENDPNIRTLLDSGTPVVTVFGKSWTLHVTDALRTTPDENLKMIRDSVSHLVQKGRTVIFDAEHYFDGFAEDSGYALATVKAALEAGASTIVVCDTNGGSLRDRIISGVEAAREVVPGVLGIHAHNDSGLAVANSLAAVEAGCRHVQGTVNGFGERCGNADICVLIPDLVLKMGFDCSAAKHLGELTSLSHFVYEAANHVLVDKQPFVGRSAFAHKGGVHVSAVRRNRRTYEHVEPESVGNQRRFLVSELAGRSNVLEVVGAKYGLEDTEKARAIAERVQELEHEGWEFEQADASFDLLVRRMLLGYDPFFKLHGFRVHSEIGDDGRTVNEASIKIEVEGEVEHTVGEGNGPVDALNAALRKALLKFYPQLDSVALADFRVRITNPRAATAAKTLVVINTIDLADGSVWGTVGASENIIEASWLALVDSVEYKLLKEMEREGKL